MARVEEIAALLRDISDSPLFEAGLIYDKNISGAQLIEVLNRRRQGEPLSKILGEKGFYKHIFKTDKTVLDPRPDSEVLVEGVLQCFSNRSAPLNILDIGTGSGCLIISLLSEYRASVGVALDKSIEALKIARYNAQSLIPQGNISFLQRDFMCAGWTEGLGLFDIIVSNPPYIKTSEIEQLDRAVRLYDPLLALDGGADGLRAYQALASDCAALLKQGGKIFFEIGQGQENDVTALMERYGFTLVRHLKDYGGIIRVLIFERGNK